MAGRGVQRLAVLPWLLSTLLLTACDGGARQLSEGGRAWEASLALRDEGLAVAWHDGRHGADEIYLRLLDAELRPVSAEFRLTDNDVPSYEPSVAALDDKLAVAWYDKARDGRLSVHLGLWNAAGERLWQREVSAPELSGRVPVLRAVQGQLFLAWVEEPLPAAAGQGLTTVEDVVEIAGGNQQSEQEVHIRAAWFSARGAYASPPFTVAPVSFDTWNLNADLLPDGCIALVYDAAYETAASELYLAGVGREDAQRMRLSRDDGQASKYPDIAINGERAALSWHDARDGNHEVYLALFEYETQFRGAEEGNAGAPLMALDAAARRITQGAGDSIGAYLSWNGAVLGLAWNDDEAGDHDIYFRSFDRDGSALTPSRRLSGAPWQERIPAIVPLRAGFALAWNTAREQGGHGSGSRSDIVVEYVE